MGSEQNNFNLVTKIEAILYLKGKPTTLDEMVELTKNSLDNIESAIIQLMSDYAHRSDSALEVVETPAGYSLQLRSCCQDLLQLVIVYSCVVVVKIYWIIWFLLILTLLL